MEPFADIENMTLERFYNNYIFSKGEKQYRIVVLGFWSVDIKKRLKFFTDNPDNTQMQRLVLRGETHHRQRPQNARFVVGSDMDSLTKREIGDGDRNWLGYTW